MTRTSLWLQTRPMRNDRPEVSRRATVAYGSALAIAAGVAAVLAIVLVYELLLVGAQGTRQDWITTHLVVAAIATTSASASVGLLRVGRDAGVELVAMVLGTAAGLGLAVLIALATGNGPDEGDGFFWLVVGALLVSMVGAVVASVVGARLRRRSL